MCCKWQTTKQALEMAPGRPGPQSVRIHAIWYSFDEGVGALFGNRFWNGQTTKQALELVKPPTLRVNRIWEHSWQATKQALELAPGRPGPKSVRIHAIWYCFHEGFGAWFENRF